MYFLVANWFKTISELNYLICHNFFLLNAKTPLENQVVKFWLNRTICRYQITWTWCIFFLLKNLIFSGVFGFGNNINVYSWLIFFFSSKIQNTPPKTEIQKFKTPPSREKNSWYWCFCFVQNIDFRRCFWFWQGQNSCHIALFFWQ